MIDLSIIIVSYNTKNITRQCLVALQKSLKKSPKIKTEIIIVDNASTDGSVTFLKKFQETSSKSQTKTNIQVINNRVNVGFGKANNQGVKKAQGTYILFLNSDVIADSVNFSQLLDYMQKDTDIGVLTVKVKLPHGSIDPASHRGFPTIWRSFCYYAGLKSLFKKIPILSRVFGGYHLTHLDLKKIHEIDSPTAAFYLTKKDIFDDVGGFDESFFMYGEDLDLSYRIKKEGYKIIYYPLYSVLHLKYQSGLQHEEDGIKKLTKKYFYDAMKIFYDKHYGPKNNFLVNKFIHLAIECKKRMF